MPGKAKRSKGRKRSTPVRDVKDTPITSAAREFLYECPGSMDTNENRDKFLKIAKRDEMRGHSLYSIVGSVVRAAYFQGQAVGREMEAD